MGVFKKLKMLNILMVGSILLSASSVFPVSFSISKNSNFKKIAIPAVTISVLGLLGVILYFFTAEQKKDNGGDYDEIRIDEEFRVVLDGFADEQKASMLRFYAISSDYTALHLALRFQLSVNCIKELIECGEDVNTRRLKTGETLFHEIEKDVPRRKVLSELLIKNGALLFGDDWIRQVVDEKIFYNHRAINVLLDLMKKKEVKNTKAAFEYLLRLMKDQKTSAYDKQTAIIYLFELYKAENIQKNYLEQCLAQMLFNYRFFNSGDFTDVLRYAIENNLKDVKGNSILYTAVIHEKSKIAFRVLLNNYNRFSYTSKSEDKLEIKREMEKALKYTKSKKMRAMFRNFDIVWDDLKNKNLIAHKQKTANQERLEAAVVGNIMSFAGEETFKRNKIYYS